MRSTRIANGVKRRAPTALLLALCVLFAGCASSGVGSGPTGTTTEGCPPPTNFSTRPLPEKPETLTNETAVAFAVEYEEATTWNDVRKSAEIDLSVDARGSVVNRTETGYVVHVTGGFSTYSCHDGARAVGDGFISANYFVNNTTVVRLEYPDNRRTDPRTNGAVVERWSSQR